MLRNERVIIAIFCVVLSGIYTQAESSLLMTSEESSEDDTTIGINKIACMSEIDCPAKHMCHIGEDEPAKTIGFCRPIPKCYEDSGRLGGNKIGDCVLCSTQEQCGWYSDNQYCWPDGTCRQDPPYFVYTTSFDDPDTLKTNFTDGEEGCISIGLNVPEILGKYFSIDITEVRECAIRKNIDPRWYGKHTMHGKRAPFAIEPYDPTNHKKTGCRTDDPRIHTSLIYSVDRDKPIDVDSYGRHQIGKKSLRKGDKFVVSVQQNSVNGRVSKGDTVLVYYDKEEAAEKGDNKDENSKYSHRYGTKIIYKNPNGMVTLCWMEKAISPKDIPVYIEAEITVTASDVPPEADIVVLEKGTVEEQEIEKMEEAKEGIEKGEEREKEGLETRNFDVEGYHERLQLSYLDLLYSFGVKEITTESEENVVVIEGLTDETSSENESTLKTTYSTSNLLIPCGEYVHTWVDCPDNTKFDGVAGICETPGLDYWVHVAILITSALTLIFLFIYIIIARMYTK